MSLRRFAAGLFLFAMFTAQTFSPSVNVDITITPAGALSTTVTFVNDGVSTQAAGQPTQTFGWIFKDGDICSGDAPRFLVGATVQKFSASPANARRYYASGCLMFSTFSILPTFSVKAGASQAVRITNGGTWPSASARSLSELYGQNLVVNAPSTGVTGFIPTSAVSAWLEDPSGDASNYKQTLWLSGDAGEAWQVDVNMAATKAGTPDPQLRFSFYVQALNDSSGNLAGYRWGGDMRRPRYNSGSTPPGTEAFAPPNSGSPTSGLNWQIKPASSTITTALSWPLSSVAFTTTSCSDPTGGTVCGLAASNVLYQGSGGNAQFAAAYITCSSCPTGLSNNQFLWVGAIAAPPFKDITFHWASSGTGDTVIRIGNSGSGTINSVPAIGQFQRLGFYNSDGGDLFFQGTGSISAETTLRSQIDTTYWQSTGLIPPYDLSGVGTGNIPDTTWNYPWYPFSLGTFPQAQSAAGNGGYIGELSDVDGVDFFHQSKLSNRLVHIVGLAEGLQIYDFKDATTDTIVNMTGISYTGLPASATNLVWGGTRGGPRASGFTPPPDPDVAISMDTSAGEHRPRYSVWAWLRTGEPQYAQRHIEQAIGGLLYQGGFQNPTAPYAANGVLDAWGEARGTEFRQIGWPEVDLQYAALFWPYDPTHPTNTDLYGTQIGKMFNALADLNVQFALDVQNPATNCPSTPGCYGAAQTYFNNRGLWVPYNPGIGYLNDGQNWELAYVLFGFNLAVARGNSIALSFINNALKNWNYELTNFGGFTLYHYYQRLGVYTGVQHVGPSLITNDNDWLISEINTFKNSPGIQWKSGNPTFTFSGSLANGYAIHNGDLFMFRDDGLAFGAIPGGFSDNTSYKVTNVSGSTFQLSPANSRAVLTPTDTNSSANFDYRPNPANAPTNTWPYANDYPLIVRAEAAWAKAQGANSTWATAIINDVNFRIANNPSFPEHIYTFGPQWYLQDHFGRKKSQ